MRSRRKSRIILSDDTGCAANSERNFPAKHAILRAMRTQAK
jgi:hypothetical protein